MVFVWGILEVSMADGEYSVHRLYVNGDLAAAYAAAAVIRNRAPGTSTFVDLLGRLVDPDHVANCVNFVRGRLDRPTAM